MNTGSFEFKSPVSEAHSNESVFLGYGCDVDLSNVASRAQGVGSDSSKVTDSPSLHIFWSRRRVEGPSPRSQALGCMIWIFDSECPELVVGSCVLRFGHPWF